MSSRLKVEALLGVRSYLDPKLAGDRVYFASDLSGRLSLYAMALDGGAPARLLPPDVALQNPKLMIGSLYHVLPQLGELLVMIDQDGDENYQPMRVPLAGGTPEALLGDQYLGRRLYCAVCHTESCRGVFMVEDVGDPVYQTIVADLRNGATTLVARSSHQSYCLAANEDVSRLILADMVTFGDEVVYLWEGGIQTVLVGTPASERPADSGSRLTGIRDAAFAGAGALLVTAIVDDTYGLGYVCFERPQRVEPVEIMGTLHSGCGELVSIDTLGSGRYRLTYNIDGCSWVYAGRFAERPRRFIVDTTLCGTGELHEGVMQGIDYDRASGRHVLSFSTATSPSRLVLVGSAGAVRLTDQPLAGIPSGRLSAGEDASFESHDGLRISARLYLPARELGFDGPRPVVFYLHGGPRSQERPDFAWFSMPLIQLLTLSGFAAFVPNARGSTGYGISFAKQTDGDWGGLDRLDHVAAIERLRSEPRVDTNRLGVVGRSYGGYMALNLVGRHPDLWKAACSMFGPYDLVRHLDRIPETWKTYLHQTVGHPERDRDHLIERSPRTHLANLACPLLVIQGANDPRVVEAESTELVEELRNHGKTVEYLLFEDEGHNVTKHANKVTCYSRIVDFFSEQLLALDP